MDTATASLVNKPLKETERPLDDASPVPGCYQLAAHTKIKQEKINRFKQHVSTSPGQRLSVHYFVPD